MPWHNFFPLLATTERLRAMGAEFRGEAARLQSHEIVLGILGLGALAFALWALPRVLALQDRFRRFHNPQKLFTELCRAHKLNGRDRQLLRLLAKRHALEHPGRLFVERNLYNVDFTESAAQAAQLKRLVAVLFRDEPGKRDATA